MKTDQSPTDFQTGICVAAHDIFDTEQYTDLMDVLFQFQKCMTCQDAWHLG